jgi:DNA-binding MarR family transcriptional regulator
MEEAGLVRRVKDDTDGRVVHVVLTDAGAALESSASAVQEELRCRTMLDDGEVTRLRSELVALADRMREP